MSVLNGLSDVVAASYAPVSDLSAISIVSNVATVVFGSGADWVPIPLTPGTSVYGCSSDRKRGGTLYQHKFKGSIPFKSIAYPGWTQAIAGVPVVLKLVLQNGDVLLVGLFKQPVFLAFDFLSNEHSVGIEMRKDSIDPPYVLSE